MPLEALLRKGETLDDLRRAFMAGVQVDESGCWLWRGLTGEVPEGSYGNFRGMAAHRVSWELHQGPVEPGLMLLHGCNLAGAERANRSCVNPGHLRPGTGKENARDRVRAPKTSREERESCSYTLRLTAVERDLIALAADEDDRSMHGEIKYLLFRELERRFPGRRSLSPPRRRAAKRPKETAE